MHWALSGGFQCAMLFCLGNGLRGTEESGEVIGGGSSNAVSPMAVNEGKERIVRLGMDVGREIGDLGLCVQTHNSQETH